MFSLSNDKMNKMTEDNPLLAMMQNAFANDNDSVKKATDAWLKAMPGGQDGANSNFAAHPMAAMAASSAVGLGMYTQMMGTMIGAMSGAMQAAEKMKDATEKSDAPFGMFFNPLTFEWSDVKSSDTAPSEAKSPPKPTSVKPKKQAAKPAATNDEQVAPVALKQAEPIAVAQEEPIQPEALEKQNALEKPAPTATPLELVETESSPVEIMPEDFKRPKKMEKPEKPDDLKQISGIGPKLEQVLNGMGIWTFAQISQWSPEEIAFVDDYLQFKGRIGRDQWLNQAEALKKG